MVVGSLCVAVIANAASAELVDDARDDTRDASVARIRCDGGGGGGRCCGSGGGWHSRCGGGADARGGSADTFVTDGGRVAVVAIGIFTVRIRVARIGARPTGVTVGRRHCGGCGGDCCSRSHGGRCRRCDDSCTARCCAAALVVIGECITVVTLAPFTIRIDAARVWTWWRSIARILQNSGSSSDSRQRCYGASY
jgi:hypothetical protein